MSESCGRERLIAYVSATALADGIRRTPLEQYVIWTGDELHGLPNSRIGRTLACVTEIGQPVSLRALVQRAARLDGDFGVPPDAVRNAVRQHQSARPTVLMLVERRPNGDFTAVADIPFAGAAGRRIRGGEVVLSARDAAQIRGERDGASERPTFADMPRLRFA